jgi:hypothetical protein
VDHGLRVDHLDSHEHAHLLPGVTAAVIDVARRTGVARLRCHRPRLFSAGGRRRRRLVAYYRAHPRRIASHALKRTLAARFARAGLSGPDGVVSPALLVEPATGGPLREWEAVVRHLPPGTWELVVHPADLEVPRDARDTAWLGELVERRGARLAPRGAAFHALLAAHGVALVSFAAVPPGRGRAWSRRRAGGACRLSSSGSRGGRARSFRSTTACPGRCGTWRYRCVAGRSRGSGGASGPEDEARLGARLGRSGRGRRGRARPAPDDARSRRRDGAVLVAPLRRRRLRPGVVDGPDALRRLPVLEARDRAAGVARPQSRAVADGAAILLS